MELTGIILAGGRSYRMKKEKAFIEFDGQTLLQRTLDILTPLFTHVYIIAKKKEPFLSLGVPVFTDRYPDGGVLGGIYTGLLQAKGPVFAVACDMPFLNPRVIRYLSEKMHDYDAVVPKSSDGLHPLHAVYSNRIVPLMKKKLKEGRVKMTDFLKEIKTLELGEKEIRPLDPELKTLININTPEELEFYRNAK